MVLLYLAAMIVLGLWSGNAMEDVYRGNETAVCAALDILYPIMPMADNTNSLTKTLATREWRPGMERFYPSRERLLQDLHSGENPYSGLDPFSPAEAQKFRTVYPSLAERSAPLLQRLVLEHFQGVPPQLVVEVGSFIGSGAVNVWGSLAQKDADPTRPRMVICVDTWEGDINMRLGSHNHIIKYKHGFPLTGMVFLRRVMDAALSDTIYPLALPSLLGARLLYLFGYKVDVIYVDSAHERGETVTELHLYYQLLKPGGLLFGDDYGWPAVFNDVNLFAVCKGVKLEVQAETEQWMIRKPL